MLTTGGRYSLHGYNIMIQIVDSILIEQVDITSQMWHLTETSPQQIMLKCLLPIMHYAQKYTHDM